MIDLIVGSTLIPNHRHDFYRENITILETNKKLDIYLIFDWAENDIRWHSGDWIRDVYICA